MIANNSALEMQVTNPTTDLSVKLQQLRRLREPSEGPPVSWHLNSALQAAERSPANKTKAAAGIFIGLLPS
jgi:hypothetical protein